MHPSVFTEVLINLWKFLPFHWKLELTSFRDTKNGIKRRHYAIFVRYGYKKSLGSSFFGAWADFHWNYERSFVLIRKVRGVSFPPQTKLWLRIFLEKVGLCPSTLYVISFKTNTQVQQKMINNIATFNRGSGRSPGKIMKIYDHSNFFDPPFFWSLKLL